MLGMLLSKESSEAHDFGSGGRTVCSLQVWF